MITQYGMSDRLGPIVFGTGHEEVFLGRELNSSRNYSENIASQIDEEVKLMVDAAYKKALKILEDNMGKLHFVAEFLLKYEVMDGEQFEAAMLEPAPSYEELEAMVAEKRKKSEEENRKVREEAERRAREDLERREALRIKEQEELMRRARMRQQNNNDDDLNFKDGDKF
jgi:hypothetical protein